MQEFSTLGIIKNNIELCKSYLLSVVLLFIATLALSSRIQLPEVIILKLTSRLPLSQVLVNSRSNVAHALEYSPSKLSQPLPISMPFPSPAFKFIIMFSMCSNICCRY